MVDLSIVLYNSSNAQAWNFMPQVPYFNLFGISQLHMISQYSPMRYPDRKLSVSLQVHYRRHHRKSPCLLVKSPFLLMESHWISHNIYIHIYIHIIYRSHQITYIYIPYKSHIIRVFSDHGTPAAGASRVSACDRILRVADFPRLRQRMSQVVSVESWGIFRSSFCPAYKFPHFRKPPCMLTIAIL